MDHGEIRKECGEMAEAIRRSERVTLEAFKREVMKIMEIQLASTESSSDGDKASSSDKDELDSADASKKRKRD